MKIAFITNLRAPYRTLQMSAYSKIDNIDITVYYTNKKTDNRKWNTNDTNGFNEVDLKGVKLSEQYGYINSGLLKIVKENDLIILGGYEQPSMILLSLLCKLLKKPYILFFDGISTDRIESVESGIKKKIKDVVVKDSSYIMANGTVGKRYFEKQFNYPTERIFNQILTIDKDKIEKLYERKDEYRKYYREKLSLSCDEKVLIYSGRLIDIKNVGSVIEAISTLDENITLLITGGGVLEDELRNKANKLGVNIIITGFIENQEDLFKFYFAGDALILPSKIEPWGLVVNEAMAVGLPVLVSNICGCSLDLVIEDYNGYVIDPYNTDDISYKIKLLMDKNLELMGNNSRELIKSWNFENSRKNLEQIMKMI